MASKRRTVILSIIVALLLAAAGVAASLFLIPGDEQAENLVAKAAADRQAYVNPESATVNVAPAVSLEEQKRIYMEELAAGSVSFQAAEAYTQSLIAANKPEEATVVWQNFVEENADNVRVWKEYARVHQVANDEDGYLRGLEHVARLEPARDNLARLSGYQNYKKDYVGQAQTLKKLVALTNEGDPQYLLDLADVALLTEDKEAALAALSSYYTKHATGLADAGVNAGVPDSLVRDEPIVVADDDVPPPPPLPEGSVVAESNKQTQVTPLASADYGRLPTYIRLLAEAERDGEALSEALAHTRDGKGESVRPAVADALLAEVGPSAAVEYIETISAQAAVPESLQAVYARALVQQGKYEVALPILKTLSTEGGDYREWYFLALSAAAKKDKEVRSDLVEHVRDSFSSGELTEAQKMDRVYALLNAGERSRALDYTERSMHSAEDSTDKTKWRDLYKALTAKPKVTKRVARARVVPRVSLDQKLVLARQSGASEDYIRRAAFEALAAKRKDDAVELFSMLAAANGPNSSDANQLVYLWGARIAGPELGWVVDRANSSHPEYQAGWVSIVANHSADEDILAIGQNFPAWLKYPVYERRYASVLMASGNPELLNQYVASQANSAQTVDVYHSIASQAESLMDMQTAEYALQKAAQADPANRETWLRMTSMYASRARYEAAEQTSANALNTDNRYVTSEQQAMRQDLGAHYFAAVLAQRDGEYTAANDHFEKVVSVGQSGLLEDRDSQVKYLSAQMALGNEQAASQGFENLLEYYPGDAVLLADYMSALLSRSSYLQALDVASRHGNDVSIDAVSGVADSSPLLIRSPNGVPPLLQSMSDGRELKLVFDGPVPASHTLFANQQMPAWVSYTTASYDTALIVAHSGYTLQAAETPDGLVVAAVPGEDATAAEAVRQRYLRLQLLYARLELETDAIDKALERLESLAPIYEEYPEYRAYQGNAEYYAGNLTRGLNLVKRAQAGDPGNEDIRYLRRNIERFRGEHLKADYEYRRLGDSEMRIATLEARKQFNNSIEVTGRYQTNDFDTDLIVRPNGNFESVDGTRWQGELSLAKFMDDSSIITGALYANDATLGGGLAYQFVNTLGTTGLYVDYHKPYWDIVEAVVADTTRDRVAASHLWRPNPKWTLRADAGVNRYHIQEKSNIADSIGVQGLVLRTLWDKQPYLALAYGFDGEYFKGGVSRNTNNGAKLLPLRSREIHSLSGIFYYDFDPDTNLELSAGYAVDRLGESGPAVEGRFTHYLAEEVDVQVRARYGLEAGNTDNDALSVGGYVRWTW